MKGRAERSPGERPAWVGRVLLVGLAAAVAVNLVNFVAEQRSDRKLRFRRTTDVEALAEHSPSRAVRYRHGTYYRLARELHGVTLHMDRVMAERHGWALEGLGEMDLRISRRPLIQIGGTGARPLIDAATYNGRLEDRRLDVLVDPAAREYVMSWVGRGERARILIVPRARFDAAKGKL
jgi:hypothetical protein